MGLSGITQGWLLCGSLSPDWLAGPPNPAQGHTQGQEAALCSRGGRGVMEVGGRGWGGTRVPGKVQGGVSQPQIPLGLGQPRFILLSRCNSQQGPLVLPNVLAWRVITGHPKVGCSPKKRRTDWAPSVPRGLVQLLPQPTVGRKVPAGPRKRPPGQAHLQSSCSKQNGKAQSQQDSWWEVKPRRVLFGFQTGGGENVLMFEAKQ